MRIWIEETVLTNKEVYYNVFIKHAWYRPRTFLVLMNTLDRSKPHNYKSITDAENAMDTYIRDNNLIKNIHSTKVVKSIEL